MPTENKVLMAQAREALQGKWGLAAGTTVTFILVTVAIQIIPVAGWLISILISGAMSIGFASFALSLSRKQDAKLSQIFEGFEKFVIGLGAYLLVMLFVLLWSLLLIVPGIIAAFSYAMTYFILADNASIGPLEAITKSKEMMRGHKWKFFCLGFRFSGWAVLCLLTCGIGFLWLMPYVMVSYANFYEDIKSLESAVVPGEMDSTLKNSQKEPEMNMQNAKLIIITIAALSILLLGWSVFTANKIKVERDNAVQEVYQCKQDISELRKDIANLKQSNANLSQDNARLEQAMKEQIEFNNELKKKVESCEAKQKAKSVKKQKKRR